MSQGKSDKEIAEKILKDEDMDSPLGQPWYVNQEIYTAYKTQLEISITKALSSKSTQISELQAENESYRNLVEMNLLTLKLQEDRKEELQSRIKGLEEALSEVLDHSENTDGCKVCGIVAKTALDEIRK